MFVQWPSNSLVKPFAEKRGTKKTSSETKSKKVISFSITLNINDIFGDVFKVTSVTAFRKNTPLRQIVGKNTIRHNEELLNVK